MQISLSVPYDPQLLRRTVVFLARSQLFVIRILGGVIALIGLLPLLLDPADPVAYAIIVCGLAFVFGIVPLTVAYSIRALPEAARSAHHLTLDDEWVQVSYPLVESRIRWAAINRIVETPEVWYMTLGKIQAVTVPKSAMTPQQQAEFAAFVSRLRLAGVH